LQKTQTSKEIQGDTAPVSGGIGPQAGLVGAPYVYAQSDFLEPVRIRMGYAPYISAGPYYIAQEKGYFKKLKIDIVPSSHVDGSLSMPSLIAGELDITGATLSAGLFNLMTKGGPASVL
jgi:NitT/TauT family transport system substrate-binding protein